MEASPSSERCVGAAETVAAIAMHMRATVRLKGSLKKKVAMHEFSRVSERQSSIVACLHTGFHLYNLLNVETRDL